MIDRDTLHLVLDRLLAGEIPADEVSVWAYEILTKYSEFEDPLVTEILFNLVSNEGGLVFEKYRPIREKLEYFMNWLESEGDYNWDMYTSLFDPVKLM